MTAGEANQSGKQEERDRSGEDRALLAAVQLGDQDALAKLYWRHAATVHRVIQRYGPGLPPQERADLVHDAFVSVFKSAGRYEPSGTVRGWICGIAANKALAAQRKQSTRARLREKIAKTTEQPRAPVGRRRVTDIRLDLRSALQELTAEDRRMLILSAVEGLTALEIARIEEMPPATVRTRLHRARRTLRDFMRKTDLRSPRANEGGT